MENITADFIGFQEDGCGGRLALYNVRGGALDRSTVTVETLIKNNIPIPATKKRCADCRDGEHDNYDDNVKLIVVKDPDTGKLVKRSYMCQAHREMYLDDGFKLY